MMNQWFEIQSIVDEVTDKESFIKLCEYLASDFDLSDKEKLIYLAKQRLKYQTLRMEMLQDVENLLSKATVIAEKTYYENKQDFRSAVQAVFKVLSEIPNSAIFGIYWDLEAELNSPIKDINCNTNGGMLCFLISLSNLLSDPDSYCRVITDRFAMTLDKAINTLAATLQTMEQYRDHKPIKPMSRRFYRTFNGSIIYVLETEEDGEWDDEKQAVVLTGGTEDIQLGSTYGLSDEGYHSIMEPGPHLVMGIAEKLDLNLPLPLCQGNNASLNDNLPSFLRRNVKNEVQAPSCRDRPFLDHPISPVEYTKRIFFNTSSVGINESTYYDLPSFLRKHVIDEVRAPSCKDRPFLDHPNPIFLNTLNHVIFYSSYYELPTFLRNQLD